MRSSAPATRPLAWAVLAAAVAEVVAPVVTILGPGSSPGAGAGADLLITPVGWAFAIWGVIYALAITQAVAALVRGLDGLDRRLQVAQLVLYLGGTVWIVLSALDTSVGTAVALLVMVAAALDAVLAARRHPPSGTWFDVLTRSSVGLYAGWVTAAVFLNVGTALVALDLVGARSLGWQLLALVAAAATLVAVTLTTRVVAYALAGIWALVGIAVAGAQGDRPAVLTVSLVGAVVVAVALTASRVAAHRRVA